MKKILVLLFCITIIFTACTKKIEYSNYDFDYFYFDTSINVKIYYQEEDNFDFEALNKGIEDILIDLQKTFDVSDKSSMISKVNSNNEVKMNEHFKIVLDKSLEACNKTNGHYDPSAGSLINLWSINNENYLPTQAEIDDALSIIDCNNIEVDDNMLFTREGMLLDFGSIVKGYAADEIEEYLKGEGVYSALLNLGGNVQVIGTKPDGEKYKIGIMKPEVENLANENAALIEIEDKAVVTSGINQRFFEKDGVIYHHILDAVEGYPVDNGLASVTIITDKGINADLLSTVTFILGLEKGTEFINQYDDVEAIFITKDKEIYSTNSEINLQLEDKTYKKIV